MNNKQFILISEIGAVAAIVVVVMGTVVSKLVASILSCEDNDN